MIEPLPRSNRSLGLVLLLLAGGAAWAQSTPDSEADQPDAIAVDPIPAETSPPAERTLEEALTQPAGALVEEGGVEDLAVDRFEASVLYRQFMKNEDYSQALEAAEIELALSEQEFGADEIGLVPALQDMGNVLLAMERPAEALTHFERSMEIVRDEEGIYSEKLFNPFMGAGKALQAMGEHEGAILNFQRAQHITHRHEGVYALAQVPAIEEIAESMMAEQRWDEAENLQLAVYKIYRGRFGADSTDSLPAYYNLARWYHDVQDYRQARLVYKRAIKVIEEQKGPDDLTLIEPLRGIASTFISEYEIEYDRGLEIHQRIVDIVEKHPDASIVDKVRSRLELGDWYVQYNREEEAWGEYRLAWELAQMDDSPDRDWVEYFSRPRLIYAGRPLTIDLMGWGRVGDEVYYDFEFTVASNGRPEDIAILGTNLHGQTRSAALYSLRSARFRPRIVDGVAVDAPGYKMRRIYPTLPPDEYGVVGVGTNSGIGGPTR